MRALSSHCFASEEDLVLWGLWAVVCVGLPAGLFFLAKWIASGFQRRASAATGSAPQPPTTPTEGSRPQVAATVVTPTRTSPPTSSTRKTGEDLLVGGFGFITSLLTAVILWVIEQQFGYALYTWMFWFVIPVGALFAGFAGASGYYLGSRIFNHRPSGLLLLNVVLASLATFGLIHYLSYVTLVVEGKQVSDLVSFWQYIDIAIRSTSMEFSFRTMKIGATGEMGGFGYIPAVLQIIGFAVGGFTVYAHLTSKPYCEKCSRYLSAKGKQVRYAAEPEPFQQNTTEVLQYIGEGDMTSAVEHHKAFGREKQEKNHLRSTITVRSCKKCGQHWAKFAVAKIDGNEWKDIPELEVAGFTDQQVTLKAA